MRVPIPYQEGTITSWISDWRRCYNAAFSCNTARINIKVHLKLSSGYTCLMPHLSLFCVTARKLKVIQELEAVKTLPSKLSAKLKEDRETSKYNSFKVRQSCCLQISMRRSAGKKIKTFKKGVSVSSRLSDLTLKHVFIVSAADVATMPLG